MTLHLNTGMAFSDWPSIDRHLWERAHHAEDIFDDAPGAHLSASTQRGRMYAYSLWLGYLDLMDPDALNLPPEQRINRERIEDYVESLQENCRETTVSHNLGRLFYVIRALCPDHDWDWLYRIARRIANRAEPIKHPQVLSTDLFRIGLRLMDRAEATSAAKGRIGKSCAVRFRDGMLIATLVEAPMRRWPYSQLRLGEHVVKSSSRWMLTVPSRLTKTGVAEDYQLSENLSRRMDTYLTRFRCAFPGADDHDFLWTYEGRPMSDKMIRRRIIKWTTEALGFPVPPHRFRNAAATFVSVADPENIRMAKDLLGHKTFAMTENHYIDGAQSRIAARTLAQLLERDEPSRLAPDEAPLMESTSGMELRS